MEPPLPLSLPLALPHPQWQHATELERMPSLDILASVAVSTSNDDNDDDAMVDSPRAAAAELFANSDDDEDGGSGDESDASSMSVVVVDGEQQQKQRQRRPSHVVLQPQDRIVVVHNGEQFAVPREPVRRGTQLRGQMLKYGLGLFRQDACGNWVCFFQGCSLRMAANFSRHILKHERQGDVVDPALARFANPNLAAIQQRQLETLAKIRRSQQQQQRQQQSSFAPSPLPSRSPSPGLLLPPSSQSLGSIPTVTARPVLAVRPVSMPHFPATPEPPPQKHPIPFPFPFGPNAAQQQQQQQKVTPPASPSLTATRRTDELLLSTGAPLSIPSTADSHAMSTIASHLYPILPRPDAAPPPPATTTKAAAGPPRALRVPRPAGTTTSCPALINAAAATARSSGAQYHHRSQAQLSQQQRAAAAQRSRATALFRIENAASFFP